MRKGRLCLRFKEDIWGLLRFKVSSRLNKIKVLRRSMSWRSRRRRWINLNFFYVGDISNKLKIKMYKRRLALSTWSGIWQSQNKVKYFYGNFDNRQWAFLIKKAFSSKGNLKDSLLSLLERRLDIFLYRVNFVWSIFFSKQLILHRCVLVNGFVNVNRHKILKPFELISIRSKSRSILYLHLWKFLCRNSLRRYLPYPIHTEVNYSSMVGTIVFLPHRFTVGYPIGVSLWSILQYSLKYNKL